MDYKTRQTILKRLVTKKGDDARNAIILEAGKINGVLSKETLFHILEANLHLLEIISYRVHNESVRIVRGFLERLNKGLELTYDPDLNLSKELINEYYGGGKLILDSLKVLNKVIYFQPDAVLDELFKYYKSPDEKLSKQTKDYLVSFAQFQIDVFFGRDKTQPGLGTVPQNKILEKINAFSSSEMETFFEAALSIASAMLVTEMSATRWDYKSVTIQTTNIPTTDDVATVREKAILLIRGLYSVNLSYEKKESLVNALFSAFRPPQRDTGSELDSLLRRDTLSVLEFLEEVLPKESLLLKQKIEQRLYFLYRKTKHEPVKTRCLQLREMISQDSEYQVFKTLVGFEGVFGGWESDDEATNFSKIEKIRESRSLQYVESISNENYDLWKARIIDYSQIKSNDLAMFPVFIKFLNSLGKQKPKLALSLLGDSSESLEWFMVPIVLGGIESTEADSFRNLVENWISEEMYLPQVSRLLSFAYRLDDELVKRVFQIASNQNNEKLLVQLVTTCASRTRAEPNKLLSDVFIPAIEALTGLRNTTWVHDFWFRSEKESIISQLGSSEIEVILENLLLTKSVTYEVEEILFQIARTSPDQVLSFFRKRIAIEKIKGFSDGYEAVPFGFDKLAKPLSVDANQVLNEVFSIYTDDDPLFQYNGGKLVKNIFPEYQEAFEEALIAMTMGGDKSKILFVISILHNYDGDRFILSVCREIVKLEYHDPGITTQVKIALQRTGVVMGEYGLVDAYQDKKAAIDEWLKDGDANVRKFATDYIDELNERIRRETAYTEERIQLRKFEFGDNQEN